MCDWCYDLKETNDLNLVESTFKELLEEGEEYLDSDYACEAIAACEVLARLKGNIGQQDSFTEDLDEWIKANPQTIPTSLIATANQALDRILAEESELNELWQDSGEYEGWKSKVEALRERLNS